MTIDRRRSSRPGVRSRRRANRSGLWFEPLEGRALLTNILFVGNSYTNIGAPFLGSVVPPIVAGLASAAGLPAPTIEQDTPPGALLVTHASLLTPSYLATLIPAGQAPDYVVIQGNSLEAASGVPTSQVQSNGPADHVAQFIQGAMGVAADIRAVYPNAHFILYQTWARSTDPSDPLEPEYYPGDYPGPPQMQADIDQGYQRAFDALRAQYGDSAVDLAPAGDAFQRLGFNSSLYLLGVGVPGSHPSSEGALVAALAIFDAIYATNASSIPASAASSLLASHGLTAPQFTVSAAAADQATGQIHAAQDQAFVAQAYNDILGREADSSGLALFTQALMAGSLNRVQVAEFLLNSPEYHTFVINDEFNLYLGRSADPAGLAYFQNLLAAPGSTIDQMRDAILGSAEYLARSGGTNAGLVANLYTQVLHRSAAPSESAYWVNLLNNGLGRAQFAQLVVNSPENRFRQVGNLYQSLLLRPADPGGLGFFTTLLTNGVRYEDVVAYLIASTEYYEHFA